MKKYLHSVGYSTQTKTGWVETKILDILYHNIQENETLIINSCKFGYIHTRDDDLKKLLDLNFKKVYLTIMADPYSGSSKRYLDNLFEQKNIKPIKIGYTNNKNFFDFWSICCNLFFKKYHLNDLIPDIKYSYLCYNRKPREHRKALIEKIIKNNLQSSGILTTSAEILGYKNTLNEYNSNLFDTSHDDLNLNKNFFKKDFKFNNIPDDIYTLGIQSIWNSCFLTVVNETVGEEYDGVFVSEKIYKPIIGMRPFVVNNKNLYNFLEEKGFKTFEKYWPVNLREGNTADNIIEIIHYLNTENLSKLYSNMYEDILYNREHFFKYSNKELLRVFSLPKN